MDCPTGALLTILRTCLLSLALATALLGGAPAKAAKGPVPKGSCAVCGMHVPNVPDWAAVITFQDGGQAWFDGPKDLFTFLFDVKRYAPRRKAQDIRDIQVKDYYGLKHIDARKAWFVLGSDVMGPMGHELVPFAGEAQARDFQKDHRGKRILGFGDITAKTLDELH